MPTNTSPKRKMSDEQCKAFEVALLKRYGKHVKLKGSVIVNEDGTYKEINVDAVSQKGNKYSLTDHLEGNKTVKAVFSYFKNNELIQQVYPRYLDAEVSMIDLIAEE